MDWQYCFICQLNSDDNLHCPNKSKRKDHGAGYTTISKNMCAFRSMGSIKNYLIKNYLIPNMKH